MEVRKAQTGCKRLFSRAQFHRSARKVYRSSSPVSRHERRTIRRIVRCQVAAKSVPIIRHHLRRYKAAHVRRRLAAMGPKGIAQLLLRQRGQMGQWPCLNALVHRESKWSVTADNPTSDAYGLPQALPGSKMASHGRDWATNPRTQLRWMLDYCRGRYGSVCGALAFSNANGYY